MELNFIRRRLDDLKRTYYNAIDMAQKSTKERKLNLTDDDIIDLTCGEVDIVESYMETLLILLGCNEDEVMYNDYAKDLLWQYIDEEISFDDITKKIKGNDKNVD